MNNNDVVRILEDAAKYIFFTRVMQAKKMRGTPEAWQAMSMLDECRNSIRADRSAQIKQASVAKPGRNRAHRGTIAGPERRFPQGVELAPYAAPRPVQVLAPALWLHF